MTPLSLLRFFAVVLRSHVTLAAVAILLLGMAGWMARYDPQEIGQVSTLALLVQMFAAATGFRQPARKGRFDPVLTTGTSRMAIAAAHWGVSIAPGLVVWFVLALAIACTHSTERPVGVTPAGVVAVLYVSSASWVLALPFTRYASGLLWMLALFVLSGMNAVPTLREAFLAYPSDVGTLLRQAGAALACPIFLVTSAHTPGASGLVVILATTVLLVAIGGLFIARLDAPLQDPS